MTARHNLTLTGLLILALAALAGLILTGRAPGPGGPTKEVAAAAAAHQVLADQEALKTAQRLAGLAATHEEQRAAQDAVTAADHELDQAFTAALRAASAQAPPQNSETHAIDQRIAQSQAAIQDDQE